MTDTAAMNRELDWPSRTNEEWRRTSVDVFHLQKRRVAQKTKSTPKSLPLEGFSGRLLFQDGVLVSASLDAALAAKGVVFGPLSESPDKVAPYLSAGLAQSDTLASSGHYSRIEFGAFLQVPDRVICELPFLIEVVEGRSEALVVPHWVVTVGTASEAALLLHQSSRNGASFTIDSAASVDLGEGSNFKFSELQNFSSSVAVLDHSLATLRRDTQFFHWCAPIGGKVVKTRYDFNLTGEGASVRTHGLYFGVKDQHKDMLINLTHVAPRCTSYALYKGAVRDRARTIFQGLIEVKPTAGKTDAYLSNKNLILNNGARADSLPQLKIDTNDVKCSHGSTTGKVNEDEIFYLTTRGFSRAEAMILIAQGLFTELVDEAPDFFRAEVELLVSCALGADAEQGTCQDKL